MIQTGLEFDGDDLSVLVAGCAAVGIARAALSGECLVLFIAHVEGTGLAGADHRGAGQRQVAGVGGPYEGCACGVHHNTQLVLRDTDGIADAGNRGVDALALRLEGQHAVFIVVSLHSAALDGKVGLTGAVEASFHGVRRAVDHIRDLRASSRPTPFNSGCRAKTFGVSSWTRVASGRQASR